MDRGEAVPFILIQENINNKDVDYSFKIHPRAYEVFTSDAVRNKKVAIAAVAGPQRTGKSFLSNRLLKRMTGFAIGPSTMPCTKGLWIWGEPIKISDDTVLIIMDTEGLNSVQRDVNVDMKIFSLSVLLSSVFIYNSIGHIDEKALQQMSYVLRVSENIKISSDNQSETEMSKYFPYFYWVLRDFSLDLKGMSEGEYLEESLKAVSNDEKDPRNQIRSKIRKLFAHRRCECFPRPVLQQNRLAHIQQLQFEDLRDGFKNKMKAFERTFYSSLPPKTINNKAITGSIFINLAHEYVNAMNTGKIPQIMNSLESVIASEVRKVCDSYKSNYKNAMDEFMKVEKLPIDEAEIEKNYKHYLSMIEQKLNEKFKIWGDVKVVQQGRAKLLQELNNDFIERKKENGKRAEIIANQMICKLFEEVSLPELGSSEQITTSLVSEKQQQFSQKYIEYMQKNKGPQKFEVFSKKFPTIVFDYLGKLVARVKGVYMNEINQLKKQSQNRLAQAQSLKRIMKTHEMLILDKQKQVQTISFQKDQYKRELKKIQQLSAFEKQSEKMGKDEKKKMMQDLKRQLVEIQSYAQELQARNKRLQGEMVELRQRPQVVHEVIKEDKKEAISENLPTELVYAFVELKGKLEVMNQFYDRKVKDETLDEHINRQIEQYRNEKYETIEKLKSEHRIKTEELKANKDKIVQAYEAQIRVINKHLDDIKNQSIELMKNQGNNPNTKQKMQGFIAEKKKFEEALRLKQNHLNSQISLNSQKQRQISELMRKNEDICIELARISSEKANLDSFKNSFWYLLRESINYVMNKANKLRHAYKSLDEDDQNMLTKTLSDLGIKFS